MFGMGGKLDEYSFWDKSLSSSEVSQIYNSGSAYDISLMTAYTSNCLAWWRMGDYSGDVWSGGSWSGWTIANVKGTSSLNMLGFNLSETDKVADAP
jgi:hypothetical protein